MGELPLTIKLYNQGKPYLKGVFLNNFPNLKSWLRSIILIFSSSLIFFKKFSEIQAKAIVEMRLRQVKTLNKVDLPSGKWRNSILVSRTFTS